MTNAFGMGGGGMNNGMLSQITTPSVGGGGGAWQPAEGQDFGANPTLNRQLAQQYGYTGDFGGGQWADFQKTLSPDQQAKSNITANQDFGQNQFMNQQLAQTFGFTGDFGGGEWGEFQKTLSPELRAQSEQMVRSGGMGGPGNPNLMQSIFSGMQGSQNSLQDWMNFQPQQLSETNLDPYMNPFQQDVIDAGMGEMNRQQDIQQNKLGAQAVQSGAFGGDRHGIAQAEMSREFGDQQQRWLANLNMQNFGQAQRGAQFDIGGQFQNQQAGFQGAQQQANLANMGFGMQQGIQQQLQGAAGQQQQTMQDLINSQMGQFGQTMGWPQQQAGMVGGYNPMGGSSTSQSSQPGMLQMAALAASIFAMCWVAREVYGETNPKWVSFRRWMLTKAPNWLCRLYARHGEKFARTVKQRPWIKRVLRPMMDLAIREN